MKKRGIILTCGGTSIVIKIIKNNTSLPLNFNFAKANPAIDANIICPNVVKTETIKLLKKYFDKGICSLTPM